MHSFEVLGNTTFPSEFIQQTMRSAIGPSVTVPVLRQALVHLQEAYRERGFAQVAVTLPRQSLTDGVVRVIVEEGANGHSSISNAQNSASIPVYDLRHFQIRGNTALTPEELDRILGPLAGRAIDEEAIRKALTQLRATYVDRGFTRVSIRSPQQLLVDGSLAIYIDEGKLFESELAALNPQTNQPVAQPPARAFEVRRYQIDGNSALQSEVIDSIFANACGANVTLPQIQKALGELQLAYRERGFVTAAVSLPQQQLTNAVVKVQVTEGVLTDVRVTGNRWFSSENVRRALPSLSTNTLLNGRVLQRELDLANQNRDRQIYPTIGPGPEPGTSALTLRVKDRLPLHGRVDINNQNTPGTPNWRVNASLSYANLWQREHQLGLSYGFTPEQFKAGGLSEDTLFNRPLIANYGAYYRMPFGSATSVQDQIDSSSGRFGYDEATHQFRLPPAGNRPDITVYANGSSSDTGVILGQQSLVTQTPLLTILSRDSGQNLTINNSAGGRLNVPLTLDDNHKLSLSAGVDLKFYSLESFNTNNFTIITVVTNAQGSQTIRSDFSSPQPKRQTEITYLPVALGADYFQTDRHGSFSASLSVNANFVGQDADFAAAATSSKAKANYGKAMLSLTRDQTVFQDWSLLMRANGQAATGPLISNEQFALGGVSSVRGYFEGDAYGDTGWFGSAELRTPFANAQAPLVSRSVPAWLRASIFFDAAQRYPLDSPPAAASFRTLLGTGFSLSANINNHIDTKITVAWPLRDTANTAAYEPRVHFSIGGQF